MADECNSKRLVCIAVWGKNASKAALVLGFANLFSALDEMGVEGVCSAHVEILRSHWRNREDFAGFFVEDDGRVFVARVERQETNFGFVGCLVVNNAFNFSNIGGGSHFQIRFDTERGC